MFGTTRRNAGIILAVAALALAGCGEDRPDDHNASAGTHAGHSSSGADEVRIPKVVSGRDPHKMVDTINGEVPPGTATFAKSQYDALKATDAGGNTVLVHYTVRAPGTRSPVHEHEFGGTTCIMAGEITLFLEGAKPVHKVAGDCYFMPPGLVMSALNSGTTDAVLFDQFVLPPGQEEWLNLELDESKRPTVGTGPSSTEPAATTPATTA